ncbi:MAG: DUF411 domain-containing protein [Phormidesmis sp.]
MNYSLLRSKKTAFLAMLLAVASIGLASCSALSDMSTINEAAMIDQATQVSELTVFHSPTCGCCGKWIEHMEAQGFRVKDEITENMDAIKAQYDVPEPMTSCHTTIVNGYVVEGHVPAADVARLVNEKPAVAGIAAPGMPIGSPGMESGDSAEPYTVFSFTESGEIASFAKHL